MYKIQFALLNVTDNVFSWIIQWGMLNGITLRPRQTDNNNRHGLWLTDCINFKLVLDI